LVIFSQIQDGGIFVIEIKRLSECTLEEATAAWNMGFSNYTEKNLQTDADAFCRRLTLHNLSPSHSRVLFADGEPAGILLNGIKELNGRVEAWNGGTGISPKLRGQGVGRLLMQAALEVYEEAGVERASLETLTDNVRAVKLYENYGFVVQRKLATFERTGVIERAGTGKSRGQGYRDDVALSGGVQRSEQADVVTGVGYVFEPAQPIEVGGLPFYDTDAPYQAHWANLYSAQGILVRNAAGDAAVGYVLFKHSLHLPRPMISLSQLVLLPDLDGADGLLDAILHTVFDAGAHAAGEPVWCYAGDLLAEDDRVVQAMLRHGFEVTEERHLMLRTNKG
jgi:ribosomal protein S18 acetylase RimI-like enzyme